MAIRGILAELDLYELLSMYQTYADRDIPPPTDLIQELADRGIYVDEGNDTLYDDDFEEI